MTRWMIPAAVMVWMLAGCGLNHSHMAGKYRRMSDFELTRAWESATNHDLNTVILPHDEWIYDEMVRRGLTTGRPRDTPRAGQPRSGLQSSGMLMRLMIPAAAVAWMLAGCAGAPFNTAAKSPEELRTLPDEAVRKAFIHPWTRTEAVAAEYMRRNNFTPREKELIAGKRVAPGMSEEALVASWGAPTRKNRTLSAYGNSTQYVYGSYQYTSQVRYVYVRDGVVTTVSD